MSDSNGTAPGDRSDEATEVIPAVAVTWPAQPPDREVITCGPCGDRFAGDPAASFTSPVVAAALAGAVTAAGWAQDAGTWTCSVCLARAGAPPEPAPAAPEIPAGTVPDSDPLDQSLAILAGFDARIPGWWAATNRSNNAAAHKNHLRFGDGLHGVAEIFGRTPALHSDPETAEGLHRYEAELAERQAGLHREALDRIAGQRSDLAPREAETAVAA